MRITRISEAKDLAPIAADWNRLANGHPLRSSEWHFAWWDAYSKDRELFVLGVFSDDDRLIGLAPWFREATLDGALIVRCLGADEVCTDHLSILTHPEDREIVVNHIVDWMCNASLDELHRWDCLELECITPSNTVIHALADRFEQSECRVARSADTNIWQLALPDDWETYLKQLSKNRRKRFRQHEKRIAAEGLELRVVEDQGELENAFEAFVRLHTSRRETREQAGCFASDRFRAFLATASQGLLGTGRLQLSLLEKNSRPIAIEYSLVDQNSVYLYQSGIDTDCLDLSPGHLITVLLIQRAMEQGKRTFDFLRGDESYKSHWGAEPIATVGLRIAANRMRSQLRHQAWIAGSTMKDWLKSGLEQVGLR